MPTIILTRCDANPVLAAICHVSTHAMASNTDREKLQCDTRVCQANPLANRHSAPALGCNHRMVSICSRTIDGSNSSAVTGQLREIRLSDTWISLSIPSLPASSFDPSPSIGLTVLLRCWTRVRGRITSYQINSSGIFGTLGIGQWQKI